MPHGQALLDGQAMLDRQAMLDGQAMLKPTTSDALPGGGTGGMASAGVEPAIGSADMVTVPDLYDHGFRESISEPIGQAQMIGVQAAAVAMLVGGTVMLVIGGTVASVAAMPLTVAAVLYAIAIVQNYRHGNPAMQSWGYYTAQALAAAFTVGATAMLAIGVREEKDALAGAAAGPAAVALVCWWQAIRKKQAVLASTAEQRIAEQKAEALRIANPLSFVATAVLNGLGGGGALSGTGVGEVSDAFPVSLTPASYAFSIWGIM